MSKAWCRDCNDWHEITEMVLNDQPINLIPCPVVPENSYIPVSDECIKPPKPRIVKNSFE